MKSKATAREQGQASSLLPRFWLLDVLLPGLSLAGILAGFHLQSPTLIAGGVLTLGLRFIVAGWIAVRDRQILVWNTNYRVFTDAIRQYRGPAAVPMGIAGLLVGGVLATLALAHLEGTSLDAMRSTILAQPSLALVPVGGGLALYGLGFLMGFRDDGDILTGPAAWNALLGMPARLGGLVLFILGAALLGAGGWVALHPDALTGLYLPPRSPAVGT